MKKESLEQALKVYEIESECIREMATYFDEEAFGKAAELLKNARFGVVFSVFFHYNTVNQNFT